MDFEKTYGVDLDNADPKMVEFVNNARKDAEAMPMTAAQATEAIMLLSMTAALQLERLERLEMAVRTQQAVIASLATVGPLPNAQETPFDVPDIDAKPKRKKVMN